MHRLSLLVLGALALACGSKDGDSDTEHTEPDATLGTSSSSSGPATTAADETTTGGQTSTGSPGTSSTSTEGTATGTDTAETAGSGSSGADLCPDGTCILFDGGPCEEPSGPLGNGCCGCGADDKCSAFCRCADPATPVATPAGERAIAALRPGDLVYSVHRGQIASVPVLQVSKLPAPAGHIVVRATLADGRAVVMSPGHPTADGRSFRDVRAGDRLGEAAVVAVERVPYAGAFTHDILPGSDSGTYFAAGALVGTTLAGLPAARCEAR